jgi:hypothetical protein
VKRKTKFVKVRGIAKEKLPFPLAGKGSFSKRIQRIKRIQHSETA